TGNHSGYDFSVLNYVINMLGLRISYNFTWWYVSVYYCMVFISPFVFSYLKGRIKNTYVILVACLFLIMVACYFGYAYHINDIEHYLTIARNIGLSSWTIYPVIFIEGMVYARYDVMENILGRISVLESLLLLLAVFVLRTLFTRMAGDFIFDIVFVIPFVIGLSGTLGRCRYVKEFYAFIGKYSSYMWFVHAYFYAYLFFNLVMRSDASALVYLQVCIYSLLAAMVFSFVMNDRDILFRRYRDFLDRTIQK
ncbi:MAG: hypothetical protein IKX97_07525, partial [Erysipelotrichaceae bacterium]|nr:hypothetical protein [Erysipelotrichaceae bacterium]